VLTKPSGEISLDIERSARDIVVKVRQIGKMEQKMKRLFSETHKTSPIKRVAFVPRERSHDSRIIIIGASTGGPPLIERLLSVLDPTSGISVFIVQHMSRYFTELFAERLDRVTDFSVREAKSGELPKEGEALVVPGGMCLEHAYTDEGEPLDALLVTSLEGTHEIEIDRTMKAIAELYGERAIGILLSGMGNDGAEGMAEIKKRGGITIVQHPDDAVVASMPKSALSSADIDHVLSVDEIPKIIGEIIAS
jgi:two-component system chemotaxis response regulator CheB